MAATDTERYVAYVHGERRGTILGQWVCVNPPSFAEFLANERRGQ